MKAFEEKQKAKDENNSFAESPKRIVKEEILSAIDTQSKGDRKVPLSGIRKIIAQRLSQSKHSIPHVYFKIEVDASNIINLKNSISESVKARTGKKPTLNDFIVKAAAAALEEFPDINASLLNDEIVYHENINIGIAVDSERGLVVPVIKNANRKRLLEISGESGALVDKARNVKLEQYDISGGTFTISNLGAYHIEEFSAIINPPESAILAVGRASDRPYVLDGQLIVRPLMNITISVDHRIID